MVKPYMVQGTGHGSSICQIVLALFLVISDSKSEILRPRFEHTKKFECNIIQPSDFKPKHLYIRDKEYSIILQSSLRTPHKLLTKVVATFLQKYLGYLNVNIVYDDVFYPAEVLTSVGYNNNATESFIPKAVVNLEVWVPPGYSNEEFISFNTDSYLGTGGRIGWFFEARLVREYGILDHWRAFEEPDLPAAKIFSRTPQELRELNDLMLKKKNGSFYCEHPKCRNGIFTPAWCHDVKCSVLFSSFNNTSGFLIDQVERMKLYVSVVWIGPHLTEKFIKQNINLSNNRSGLFYHWTPDVDIRPFNFTSVLFPACKDKLFDDRTGEPTLFCRYEVHAFHKYIWSGLKKADSFLYETLKRIALPPEDYLNLIDEYIKSPNLSIDVIACNYLRKNLTNWRLWRDGDSKPPLYFVGLFPLKASSVPSRVKFVAPGNLPAFTMAVNSIRANHSILPDFEVKTMVVNTACEPNIVMHEFINIIKHSTQNGAFNKIIGIVGPACSDTVEPIAGVSKFIKIPIISYGAEGAIFSNRDQYPYFYRTIPENKIFRHVYLQLFKELKWTMVASLTEDGHQYSEYLTPLQDLFQTNDIVFHMRKYPQERETDSMEQYLLSLKNNPYKIIIGDFYQDVARRVMCEALKLGMTGKEGYVWILPRWFSSDWYDMDNFNETEGSPIPCTTAEMVQALNGHMALSYQYFASDDFVTHENRTVLQWRQEYEQIAANKGVPISDYAGFTYDATWTYAIALDKLFRENSKFTSNLRSNETMERFMHYIDQTNFMGVSGPVNFTHGTSRLTDIIIWQFNGEYNPVGRFYPDPLDKNWGRLVLHRHLLKWPQGSLPKDGSKECVIESFRAIFGDGTSCNAALIVLCTISFGTLAVILVSVVIFLRYRFERKLRVMEELWKNHSIFKKFEGWELPRTKVVINRKLGEGQFGTVYGGECHLENQGWVAVAVKTLKVGSTIAEKLDFLFEAEVMKQFDHDNIVKLLGVCTESEPIYTVMEFMLYGDLKTYLLARRNFVADRKLDDDDEVSNKRLTMMALDVANALEYLAEIKYVHRDIACRNCLVNAYRSVKLADFGMTRELNENNYYRFNRKGMLPVRWMAIESLIEGVFTPMSDMWSYGVLLFEIITFGAFPFQGLSNNEVFERVKTGHTLTIPSGVKPQLAEMLQACWNENPNLRPTPDHIIAQMTRDPRLVTPCLDDPIFCNEIEAIPLEHRGSDRSRRLSLTGRQVPAQLAASALQGNRKRSFSGNMIISNWEETGVLDALNLNGAIKCSYIVNGDCHHLSPGVEPETHLSPSLDFEKETLIKRELSGVASHLL